MREWTRDVRGMLQRARESGNRERRRVRSFRFFMIHYVWKTFRRERERENESSLFSSIINGCLLFSFFVRSTVV